MNELINQSINQSINENKIIERVQKPTSGYWTHSALFCAVYFWILLELTHAWCFVLKVALT